MTAFGFVFSDIKGHLHLQRNTMFSVVSYAVEGRIVHTKSCLVKGLICVQLNQAEYPTLSYKTNKDLFSKVVVVLKWSDCNTATLICCASSVFLFFLKLYI